ncbi:MAG: Asd/ArgC dimerization domain-containing protein [Thermoanaerobaculia bacterium]|nr:Asd/ArgC dimerization domain-containing protein [Thermoanaerobaculia bacterium]
MKSCALLFPTTLLGEELRECLAERPDLCDELELYTTDEDAVGTLAEFRGAGMVQRFEPRGLSDVDLVFVAGAVPNLDEILDQLPAGVRTILVAPQEPPEGAVEIVDGVNLDDAAAADLVVSPHPAVVHVAHLVQPLLEHGLEELTATVLQPVSMLPGAALDELLEQSRDLLSFEPVEATDALPHQAAFNLFPTHRRPEELGSTFRFLWGERAPRIQVQLVQTGVFHCLSASAELRFDGPVEVEEIQEILESAPHVMAWDDPDQPLSPVGGATRNEVLIDRLTSGGEDRPEVVWLWSVMDNLTRGGALNAMAIAEAMLPGPAN